MRLALIVATILVALAAAVVGSYWLSLTAIDNSNSQWCDTLTLITTNAHPNTPSSREFYAKLHVLERHFGCDVKALEGATIVP